MNDTKSSPVKGKSRPSATEAYSGKSKTVFIIGIVNMMVLCLMLLLSILKPFDYQTVDKILLFFNYLSIIMGIVAIVGIVLGIIGLNQKPQTKVYAIIGLVLNALVLLLILGIWISSM